MRNPSAVRLVSGPRLALGRAPHGLATLSPAAFLLDAGPLPPGRRVVASGEAPMTVGGPGAGAAPMRCVAVRPFVWPGWLRQPGLVARAFWVWGPAYCRRCPAPRNAAEKI